MDPSSAQQHQEMGSQTLESMLICTKAQQDQKPKPTEQALKCPRCDSSNTKFCYYNNYSLTQPRYFCKSCRRYWTKGGTLRNVPVGGGCRKNNKRSSSSSSSSKRSQDHQPLITTNHINPLSSLTPALSYGSTDLSLAFARLQNQASSQLGFDHDQHDFSLLGNPNDTPHCDILGNPSHGFLDALRSGFLETPINGFHNVYYGGIGNGDHHIRGVGVNVSEEMGNFPYEDLMSSSSSGATTTAVTIATVKQEAAACNGGGREAAENRVLLGYPWQLGGDGSMGGGLDAAGRQSWINGLGSSNWHGLLNSPLM